VSPRATVTFASLLITFNMDLQQAIDAARFRHLDGWRVALEAPTGDDVRRELTCLGHVIAENRVAFGGSQMIQRLPRGWAADPRKDGLAIGH